MKNNNDRRRPKQQKTDEPSDVSMEPGEVDNVGGSREAVSMSRFLVESPASRPGGDRRITCLAVSGASRSKEDRQGQSRADAASGRW
jgi:hypothetical protein